MAERPTPFDPQAIEALTFDVFGTVVDWRGSLIRDGATFGAARGLTVDWAGLADAWRAGYPKAMDRARRGEIAWANIDVLHRGLLDELIPRFGLQGLSEADRVHLNRAWHRLDPWPDVREGLRRLRTRFVVATLSNGNLSLLIDLARHGDLCWDCLLSAELMGHYKPDPQVYQGAARLLDVAPQRVLMVASHPSDLRGAQRAGLRTALVRRPLEYGPNPQGRPPPDAQPDDVFDHVADDFVDLARGLGVAEPGATGRLTPPRLA